MKMNKKKLLSLALVLVLIATLSFGTLAWFSASDEVTNKFMVAESTSDPDKIFSVQLWEEINGEEDFDGATFENILPGARYEKKPLIKNTGIYDQYIRVKVTVTNADAWIAAMNNRLGGANNYDLANIFEGHDETKWTRYEVGEYNAEKNTYSMTFYLNEKLAPNATACLFEEVVIPYQLTQQDMVFIGGGFDLIILAQAIQTENLGIDAEAENAVYEAFKVVMP